MLDRCELERGRVWKLGSYRQTSGAGFTRKHPSIPVVLASREVQFDDLSDGRLAIAGATVKVPLSRARIIEVKSAALVNSGIWRTSVRSRLDVAKRAVR
jgi:hypothetical protein